MLAEVAEIARFGIITAFLITATYHFATNEPQSCIVGGETTLYTITLGFLYFCDLYLADPCGRAGRWPGRVGCY